MNHILISGYAKFPAHITSEEVFKTLVLAVAIDMDNHTIVKAEPSMVTDLTKRFISNMLVGYNMEHGPNALLEKLRVTYFGHAKKALETTIRMIFNKYDEVLQGDYSGT